MTSARAPEQAAALLLRNSLIIFRSIHGTAPQAPEFNRKIINAGMERVHIPRVDDANSDCRSGIWRPDMMTFKRAKAAMSFKQGLGVAAIALILPMTAISTGNALPVMSSPAVSTAASTTTDVTPVQWRGHRGAGWGRGGGWGYRGGGGYYRGGGWGGVGAGIAAGALIGGAIAGAPYGYGGYYGYNPGYYAPAPGYVVQPAYGGDDAEAYCMQRYRSYDPASGTYLNNDGNRYPCP